MKVKSAENKMQYRIQNGSGMPIKDNTLNPRNEIVNYAISAIGKENDCRV